MPLHYTKLISIVHGVWPLDKIQSALINFMVYGLRTRFEVPSLISMVPALGQSVKRLIICELIITFSAIRLRRHAPMAMPFVLQLLYLVVCIRLFLDVAFIRV